MLALIEADLTTVKSWKLVDDGALSANGARAFTGRGSKFTFLVVAYSIEDQGFPPGSLGYDGTASGIPAVVHLTRELAEKAFKQAVQSDRTGVNK